MASVKPFSPKFVSSRLKVVTIAISPKSMGVRSRARTTVAMIWMANENPEEKTVTPALRTATRRNPPPSAAGRNAPLSSKGTNRSPDLNQCDTLAHLNLKKILHHADVQQVLYNLMLHHRFA